MGFCSQPWHLREWTAYILVIILTLSKIDFSGPKHAQKLVKWKQMQQQNDRRQKYYTEIRQEPKFTNPQKECDRTMLQLQKHTKT